jgi:fused signal recognition particle receptor
LGRLFGARPAAQPEERPAAPDPVSAAQAGPPAAPAPKSWWRRLRDGLSRSSSALGEGIAGVFTKRKLDASTLDELEDVLIQADLGVATATRVREAVGKGRYDKTISPDEVRDILAAEIEKTLAPVARPLEIDATKKPFVILVVGVNGSGKTTTIGKLAAKFADEGRKTTLAAGDTFRAAAIEQLKIWGERAGAAVVARPQGADAAALAFDAMREAQANGSDVLVMDTAGRLQNRKELMDELEKIVRVMKKVDAAAPHAVLLALDATVGQNALNQVEIFGKVAGVTGLAMTKLDGTARGGILVAIADRFGLPVHFIGVGEGRDDLEPFSARDFARAIAGLDD